MKFLSDKRVILESRILTLESKMIVPGLSEFGTRRKQVDKNLSAYVAHRPSIMIVTLERYWEESCIVNNNNNAE